MKKKITSLLLLLLIIPFGQREVCANSAQKYFEGYNNQGVIMMNESPIVVLQEDLTFNIDSFPNVYANNNEYKSNVSAKYTFHNPSENYITSHLVFPFYDMPYNYYENENNNLDIYGAYIDNEKIELNERYTYSYYKYDFSIDEDINKLRDDYVTHKFYTQDLKVDHYQFNFIKMNSKLTFDYMLDNDTRLISKSTYYVSYNSIEFHSDNAIIDFYIVGNDNDKLSLNKEDYIYSSTSEIIDIEYEEIDFKTLVLSQKSKELNISDIDYYNAVIDSIELNYEGYQSLDYEYLNVNDNLIKWFDYSLSFAPKQTIVNEVIVPIYPDVDEHYDPTVYRYHYLLSPAKTWKEFSNLNIRINTNYYMQESSLEGFIKDDKGYSLHLDKLPDSELEFSLSTAEKSKRESSIYTLLILALLLAPILYYFIFVVCFVLLIIFLIIVVKIITKIVRKYRTKE